VLWKTIIYKNVLLFLAPYIGTLEIRQQYVTQMLSGEAYFTGAEKQMHRACEIFVSPN